MNARPRKTSPSPMTVSPRLCTRSPRKKKYIAPPSASPTKPSICGFGAYAMIHTVAVVPMFAPIKTANACGSVMRAVETNPTSITVMMDEDCTMIVETMPLMTPTMRWPVARLINLRSPFPAAACSPSDKCFIPSRKIPNPPSTVRSIVKASFIAAYAKSI